MNVFGWMGKLTDRRYGDMIRMCSVSNKNVVYEMGFPQYKEIWRKKSGRKRRMEGRSVAVVLVEE